MLELIYALLSLPILTILLLFNARRLLFALSIFFAPRRPVHSIAHTQLPNVLILVPCRDEEALVAGLGRALAQLDYPRDKLQVVLIDDGSRDGTRAAMQHLASNHANWHVLPLDENVGKSRALNTALAHFRFGEIVYVYDADHRPLPDALQRAMCYFDSPTIAGVSGRTIPSNALASPSAFYSTVESYVHQMMTMRAKDRLDLAPALLGSNCGYRRSALEQCGGFRPGVFLEDSDLTLSLCRAGYRLRFAEDASALHQVPETVRGYLKQHARWGRGFNDVARDHALALMRESNLPIVLRAELVLFTLGYVDRLALLGAGIFSLLTLLDRRLRFPRKVLLMALITPLAQIVALFVEQRVPAAMWCRLPLVPLFFALDIFAAVRAMFDFALNRTRVWTRTERAVRHA